MQPSELFRHCPRCGLPRTESTNPFRCASCGFLYYFNPCCAVGGIILNPRNEILLLRRAKEPAKGLLALPGGFIDIGETAEDALRRETLEEVNLELGDLSYLCSQINAYDYEDITYPVLDFFFVATARHPEVARPLDGVDGFAWRVVDSIDPGEVAFPSLRAALETFRATRPAPPR